MTKRTLLSSSGASRRRRNKAELAGQTFLYIMGIVIVAAIMIYGIRAMFKLSAQSDEVKLVEFRQDLEASIRQNMRYGNNFRQDIRVPGDFTRICFINLDENPPASCATKLDPVICESWSSDVRNNVFLGKKLASEFMSVRNYKDENAIITDPGNTDNSVCYQISNGRFRINGLGRGSQIEIRP